MKIYKLTIQPASYALGAVSEVIVAISLLVALLFYGYCWNSEIMQYTVVTFKIDNIHQQI